MELIEQAQVAGKIFTIRGIQVMLDGDLVDLYQVGTKVLNQAVKINSKRFHEASRFQLTKNWSQTVTG